MTITKKELELEFISLEKFGLTEEELEGYFEFFEDAFQIEDSKVKKIRVLNTKKKKVMQ